jgi:hypothetical protein
VRNVTPMPISSDFREFIELLGLEKVEYLVVGAYAVAWHGHPRYTGDLDLLVRPSADNAGRVVNALHAFGFGSLGLKAADFTVPGMIVQLGFPPNRIDLLTSITGVNFDDAWNGRMTGAIGGVEVPMIGLSELLRNKESTGRTKDEADAQELRKRSPV